MKEKTPGCYLKARYILAVMGFLGMFNVYSLRTNLSVAIVAMVNSSSLDNSSNRSQTCPEREDRPVSSVHNVGK